LRENINDMITIVQSVKHSLYKLTNTFSKLVHTHLDFFLALVKNLCGIKNLKQDEASFIVNEGIQ
jgi:hypothetical protein